MKQTQTEKVLFGDRHDYSRSLVWMEMTLLSFILQIKTFRNIIQICFKVIENLRYLRTDTPWYLILFRQGIPYKMNGKLFYDI